MIRALPALGRRWVLFQSDCQFMVLVAAYQVTSIQLKDGAVDNYDFCFPLFPPFFYVYFSHISSSFFPHYPFSLSSPQQDAALCQSALHVLMRLLKPRKPKKEKVYIFVTVEQQQGL